MSSVFLAVYDTVSKTVMVAYWSRTSDLYYYRLVQERYAIRIKRFTVEIQCTINAELLSAILVTRRYYHNSNAR